MTCLLCGEVCHCVADDRRPQSVVETHLGSEAELWPPRCPADLLLANEGPEREGEQQVTSQKYDLETSRPRFVLDETPAESSGTALGSGQDLDQEPRGLYPNAAIDLASPFVQANLLNESVDSSWRDEVTERLHRYQARRRPRGPRYPSLRLKFESSETWANTTRNNKPLVAASSAPASSIQMAAAVPSVAMECEAEVASAPVREAQPPPSQARNEPTGKLIAFPRPAYAPPIYLNDLAEPVLDRPRILEAPEVVPPPPAMGGITIEEAAKAEPERRPGIDMPLQPAPFGQRLAAVALDGGLVLLAVIGFAAIFYQLAHVQPPLFDLIGLGLGLAGGLWIAYQYLLIVYAGTTPGLGCMKLQLQRFDGTLPSRRLRRWRVIGSVLSGISLGMGYAWQFLDEDALCWHERVTKTYLAPIPNRPPS